MTEPAPSPRPPGPSSSPSPRPVALVTGGARRIGRAICEALAPTHDVVIHARDSRGEAEELAERLRSAGGSAWVVCADLRVPLEAEGLLAVARDACGRPVSVLVNNASDFPERTFAETTWDDLESMVKLHAWAPLALTRALADQEDLPESACVVNLVDTRITGYDLLHVPYLLSKQMLHDVTRLTAKLLAPHVRVNAVAPGPILPPSSKSGEAAVQDLLRGAATVPLKRAGSAGEVAHAVRSLVENAYVTGQTLFVDGGRHLRG